MPILKLLPSHFARVIRAQANQIYTKRTVDLLLPTHADFVDNTVTPNSLQLLDLQQTRDFRNSREL